MALSFCIIDKKMKKMKFSGAEQSILISRKINTETEIIEIKGDAMPIAIYIQESSFTEHDIILKENDCIYLLTDGYFDQLGGNDETLFMKKNFIKIIKDINIKPMTEQKNIIENKIFNWMGEYNTQIDDILIIGFRI